MGASFWLSWGVRWQWRVPAIAKRPPPPTLRRLVGSRKMAVGRRLVGSRKLAVGRRLVARPEVALARVGLTVAPVGTPQEGAASPPPAGPPADTWVGAVRRPQVMSA